MSYRKIPLVKGEIYHIFTKSIAGFKIFNNNSEFERVLDVIRYYQKDSPSVKFSQITRPKKTKDRLNSFFFSKEENIIEIIAYCIMPTHIHLILKQLKENGISRFMSNILNSYTRYFNLRHERKGPLWEGRFKNVLVETDAQLLHLSRYIHLNPVTAYLVDDPADWNMSSYKEYLSEADSCRKVCKYDDILDIEPLTYKKFVKSRISDQRLLAEIGKLLFD